MKKKCNKKSPAILTMAEKEKLQCVLDAYCEKLQADYQSATTRLGRHYYSEVQKEAYSWLKNQPPSGRLSFT